jgi:hypothetical protein
MPIWLYVINSFPKAWWMLPLKMVRWQAKTLCKIVFLDFLHHLGVLKNHNISDVGSEHKLDASVLCRPA